MMERALPASAALVVGIACAGWPAAAIAASCSRSQQYILESTSGTPPQPPQLYRALHQVCEETLLLSNVRDAFILTTGAIAVIPKRDGIAATAATLAEFCTRFPTRTLRFVSRRELPVTSNIGRAVRLDSSSATSCQRIVQ